MPVIFLLSLAYLSLPLCQRKKPVKKGTSVPECSTAKGVCTGAYRS